MLHMFISHTSLSSSKSLGLRVETALLMLIQGQQRGNFYSAGDGEWGALGRGTRFTFGIRGLAEGGEHWTPNDTEQRFYLFWVLTFLFFFNSIVKAPFNGCFIPAV